jgi:PKD repeat protein
MRRWLGQLCARWFPRALLTRRLRPRLSDLWVGKLISRWFPWLLTRRPRCAKRWPWGDFPGFPRRRAQVEGLELRASPMTLFNGVAFASPFAFVPPASAPLQAPPEGAPPSSGHLALRDDSEDVVAPAAPLILPDEAPPVNAPPAPPEQPRQDPPAPAQNKVVSADPLSRAAVDGVFQTDLQGIVGADAMLRDLFVAEEAAPAGAADLGAPPHQDQPQAADEAGGSGAELSPTHAGTAAETPLSNHNSGPAPLDPTAAALQASRAANQPAPLRPAAIGNNLLPLVVHPTQAAGPKQVHFTPLTPLTPLPKPVSPPSLGKTPTGSLLPAPGTLPGLPGSGNQPGSTPLPGQYTLVGPTPPQISPQSLPTHSTTISDSTGTVTTTVTQTDTTVTVTHTTTGTNTTVTTTTTESCSDVTVTVTDTVKGSDTTVTITDTLSGTDTTVTITDTQSGTDTTVTVTDTQSGTDTTVTVTDTQSGTDTTVTVTDTESGTDTTITVTDTESGSDTTVTVTETDTVTDTETTMPTGDSLTAEGTELTTTEGVAWSGEVASYVDYDATCSDGSTGLLTPSSVPAPPAAATYHLVPALAATVPTHGRGGTSAMSHVPLAQPANPATGINPDAIGGTSVTVTVHTTATVTTTVTVTGTTTTITDTITCSDSTSTVTTTTTTSGSTITDTVTVTGTDTTITDTVTVTGTDTTITDTVTVTGTDTTITDTVTETGTDTTITDTVTETGTDTTITDTVTETGSDTTFTVTETDTVTDTTTECTMTDTTTDDEVTAFIDWGDGTSSEGNAGGGAVSGTHTYEEEGTYIVTVTITDDEGLEATAETTAVVLDADLSGEGTDLTESITEGESFDAQVASFHDDHTTDSAGDYSVEIDWGDGTSSSGTVEPDPSGGPGDWIVVGDHTYDEEGTYDLQVTIADDDGGASEGIGNTITVSSTATVDDASLSGEGTDSSDSLTEGETSEVEVASFHDDHTTDSAGDYTVEIDWGDGTTSTGTVEPDPSGGPGDWIALGEHSYDEEGTYDLQVTIADDDGGASEGIGNTITVSSTATVDDASLSGEGTDISDSLTEGETSEVQVASFHDDHTTDSAGDYTVEIDWGDGTTSSGTVEPDPSGGDGDWIVLGEHI